MDKQHPINSVMQTALENIKDMIDVNTVVGDPVITGSGGTVIPVSKSVSALLLAVENTSKAMMKNPSPADRVQAYRCNLLAFWF